MKLKFKVQPYQTYAVDSVVDCFAGQVNSSGVQYRIDPGTKVQTSSLDETGFKNSDVHLTKVQLLENIHAVQRSQNLPLSDKFLDYAQNVGKDLKSSNIRVEVDMRNETLQAKIRDATLQKIPYILVVGAKEVEAKSVAVRARDGKNLGQMSTDQFKDKITGEIENKA